MNNDNETKLAVAEAEALQAMFESSGWAVAERVLTSYIMTMKDISTIDPRDPQIQQTVRDRINVVAVLEEWVNDLKGRVNNVAYMVTPVKTDPLVERR